MTDTLLNGPAAAEGSRSVGRRVLEVAPTATVWVLITAPAWGAVLAPAALGVFLVLFSVYWLWKSVCFASGVLIGFWRLHHAQRHDWYAALGQIEGAEQTRHLVIVPTCG